METHSGSCICGAVTVTASGAPKRITHCHCDLCRRATGGVAGTFATWESGKVTFTGTVARYDSSEKGWRGFCGQCGSSLCFGYNPRPERIYIALGILDSSDRLSAGFHDHREDRLTWMNLDRSLPDAADFKPASSR